MTVYSISNNDFYYLAGCVVAQHFFQGKSKIFEEIQMRFNDHAFHTDEEILTVLLMDAKHEMLEDTSGFESHENGINDLLEKRFIISDTAKDICYRNDKNGFGEMMRRNGRRLVAGLRMNDDLGNYSKFSCG